MGGIEYQLQEILDQILKGILPLSATFACFGLIRKKVNPNLILIGIIVVSFVLSLLGICG